MSHILISRNADLKRLLDDGYDIAVIGTTLVVRRVPFVRSDCSIGYGVLFTALQLQGDVTAAPDDHTVRFTDEMPCFANGQHMPLSNSEDCTKVSDEIVGRLSFSRKPKPSEKYVDHYEKMTTYIELLQAQARQIDPNVNARVYEVTPTDPDDDTPFLYRETASARAGISSLSRKLARQRVAIVGLGGTGGFVLDFVAKTHVRQIHLFDADIFGQHNAFRAPGAAALADLEARMPKVEYFAGVYGKMRTGVVPHPYHMTGAALDELEGMDFVFICIDDGEAKSPIIEKLEDFGIAYVDVGMGLTMGDDSLTGILRTTLSPPDRRDAARAHIPKAKGADNGVYGRNIQIAELNALNAALAVIRWKKHWGFYHDAGGELTSLFTVDVNTLVNKDRR